MSAELAHVAQQGFRCLVIAASLLPEPLVLHAIHDVCCHVIPYSKIGLHAAYSLCTHMDSLRNFGAKMYLQRTVCTPLPCPKIAEAKTLGECLLRCGAYF